MTAAASPGGLLDALLAVQAEAPTLPKDATNPHFKSKFTPLDTIVERVGPILNKHGLVWMSKPGLDDQGRPALHYTLAHAASGQREDGVMPLLLTKNDPQGQGSAITYARRYSMCAVLNLVADEDDDGSAAARPGAAGSTNGGATAAAPPITANRAREIVDHAWLVGVEAQLQLAASHVVGDDVGDCSTKAKATVALRALTEAHAVKVDQWISRKADEAEAAAGAGASTS